MIAKTDLGNMGESGINFNFWIAGDLRTLISPTLGLWIIVRVGVLEGAISASNAI